MKRVRIKVPEWSDAGKFMTIVSDFVLNITGEAFVSAGEKILELRERIHDVVDAQEVTEGSKHETHKK